MLRFIHQVSITLLLLLGVLVVQAYVVGFEYHRFFTPSWAFLPVAALLCFCVPAGRRSGHLIVFGLFAVLAIYLGGRGVMSEVPYLAGKDYPVFYYGMLTFLAMLSLCLNRKLFAVIVIFGLVVHGYQLLIALGPEGAIPKPWGELVSGASGQGFFRHHNPFASYCAITLASLVGLCFIKFQGQKFGWALRVVCVALAVGTIIAAFNSGSRLGVAAMAMAAFFCVVLCLALKFLFTQGRLRSRNSLTGMVVILVIGVFTSAGVFSQVFSKVSEQRGRAGALEEDVMGDMRVRSISLGFQLWQESPLIGSGPRSYWYRVPGMRAGSRAAIDHFNDPEMVHNDYVQTLAEYGVIGLGLILITIFTILFLIWKVAYRQRFINRSWFVPAVIATTAIMAIMVHSLADFTPHNAAVFVPFCLVIGACYGYLLSVEQSAGFNKKVSAAPVAVINVLAVVVASAFFLFIGKNQIIHNIELVKYDYAKWNRSSLEQLEQGLKVAQLAPEPILMETVGKQLYRRAMAPEFASERDGLMRESQDVMERAVRIHPHRIYLHVNLANIAIYFGEFDQAREHIDRALELSNERWRQYHIEQACTLYLKRKGLDLWYNKRDASAAMAHFQEALRYERLWHGRGIRERRLKQREELKRYLEVLEAGQVKPDEGIEFFTNKNLKNEG